MVFAWVIVLIMFLLFAAILAISLAVSGLVFDDLVASG